MEAINEWLQIYRESWELWGDCLAGWLELGMACSGVPGPFIEWFDQQHEVDMKLLGIRS